MDERLQFVARRLAGEPMAELCREFGISRCIAAPDAQFATKWKISCFVRNGTKIARMVSQPNRHS